MKRLDGVQTPLIRAAKNLLVQSRKVPEGAQYPKPPELLAPPVEVQIAGDSPQPGGKARRADWAKTPQAAEAVASQLLANEEEGIGDVVLVALVELEDLKNDRRVAVKELPPPRLRVCRSQLLEDGCRFVRRSPPTLSSQRSDAETPSSDGKPWVISASAVRVRRPSSFVNEGVNININSGIENRPNRDRLMGRLDSVDNIE